MCESPPVIGYCFSSSLEPLKIAVTPPDPKPVFSLLENPSTTLPDLLSEPGVLLAFKSNNEKLNAFFSSPKAIFDIISFFQTSDDRPLLHTIASLFLSSNQLLLSQFRDNQEFIESLSPILFCRGDDCYVYGLLMQVITESALRWPAKVYPLFYASPTFWPALLTRLELHPIANAVVQLVQNPTELYHSILWGYLLCLIPDHRCPSDPPKSWDIGTIGVVNSIDVPLTSRHRIHLLKLFYQFLISYPDEELFGFAICRVFPSLLPLFVSDDERKAAFELAFALPLQVCMLDICLNMLRETPIRPTPILEKALRYLQTHFQFSQTDQMIRFVYNLLASDSGNNFLHQIVIDIMQTMIDHYQTNRLFFSCCQHAVALAWNRKPDSCSLMREFFILKVADMIGENPAFVGWAFFMGVVLRHFRKGEAFPRDFRIPEAEMDQGLIAALLAPPGDSKSRVSFARLASVSSKACIAPVLASDFGQHQMVVPKARRNSMEAPVAKHSEDSLLVDLVADDPLPTQTQMTRHPDRSPRRARRQHGSLIIKKKKTCFVY